MKTVAFVGLLVVFISAFFIMLIFNVLIKANVTCLGEPSNPGRVSCNVTKYNTDFVAGLIIICFFLILDMGAVYLMFSSWTV